MSEDLIVKELAIDRFEKLFYQLLDAVDRHAQDRQLLVKEKEELGKLVGLLITQTKEISQYEAGIRKRIQDCIKESAQSAVKLIEQSVTEKNNQLFVQFSSKIEQPSQALESAAIAQKNRLSWEVFLAAISVGVMSCMLLTLVIRPKPILPMNEQVMDTYVAGLELQQSLLPKLSQRQKQWLMDIANSKIKNSGNVPIGK